VLRDAKHIKGETVGEICRILDISDLKGKRNTTQVLRRLLRLNQVDRKGDRWIIIETNSDFLD